MNYPDRSPLLVAEVIKPMIHGRVVCDLGCGDGELMREFAKYASKVIGIDREHMSEDILMADLLETDIPLADVYYLWIHPRDVDAVLAKIPCGIVILGDYDKFELKQYSDIIIRFPFVENSIERWWRLQILYK